MHRSVPLDPETLLSAYAQGAFPMADRDGVIRWYTADPRGIIPLHDHPGGFHVPATLRQLCRRGKFDIRFNTAFEETMRACRETPRREGEGTWINEELIGAYVRMHRMGFAHSVEAWLDGRLVGGLYGVSLGAAFFGESMFYRARDASKVALVHLVERLRQCRFELLDTQASTPHLERFGCIEIPAEEYLVKLGVAIGKQREFR